MTNNNTFRFSTSPLLYSKPVRYSPETTPYRKPAQPQSQNHTSQILHQTTILSPSLSTHAPLYVSKTPTTTTSNNNYTSLTLSRLARDEARVNSILASHSRALSRRSRSRLRPEQFESPVISGIRQGSGEYFTGSGWVDPLRNTTWPSASSTYKPVACNSRQCTSLEVSACRIDSCLYQVSYGDGSYTVGNFATETISFGSSGSVPNVAIGCGHDNEGLFSGAAGLLGLGGGSLSLPSQIRATSFSYCLVNRDSSSSSTLEFNSAQPIDSVLAPLLSNPTHHHLPLRRDGRGGVLVDSGTAVTRWRTEVYTAMRDAFKSMTRNLPPASGFSLFDTCYDLSSMESARVPTVSFRFSGNKTLPLPPSNYLIPVDNAGKFCFAFAPQSGSLSIIGNVQQQGTRVSYNLANKYIGFSPNKC
ncbi:hypothetical protein DH2020_019576 [Rehmannia glutinosa]|uniref:Peptidase A1 domain-containing protein n=1 Tax=Rehmannia glutinosa TaxID=99300 RepID=A0ABR0WQP7_REHGL